MFFGKNENLSFISFFPKLSYNETENARTIHFTLKEHDQFYFNFKKIVSGDFKKIKWKKT